MRLIDGDALSEWLKDYGQKVIKGERETSLMYVWKHVQDMPTIEPAHGTGYRDGYKRGKRVGYKKGREAGRKKGKWIYYPKASGSVTSTAVHLYPACSECGCEHPIANFCPNCGAKMEEGGE